VIDIDPPNGDIKRADVLLGHGEHILNATLNGSLTPQQAKTIMGSFEIQRRNIEASELAKRVDAIETVLKQRK